MQDNNPEIMVRAVIRVFFCCCGISGIMGLKPDFYEVSIAIGRGLMEKIKAVQPDRLLSDCLNCRV